MSIELEVVQRITDMQKRVDRLETLEDSGILGGGGFTLLNEHIVTLANTDTAIIFPNIPQGFQHLCFVVSARLTRSPAGGARAHMEWRFNGDSGNNYRYFYRTNAIVATVLIDTDITAGFLTLPFSGAAPESNLQFNTLFGWLNHYHDATKKKSFTWHCGSRHAADGELPGHWLDSKGSGIWMNIAAITSVQISFTYANAFFKIGSKFSMFGVGEAN